MTRRNISLPDDVDDLAREAGLNVSALTRQAILRELDRRDRMRRLDAWLDAMDEEQGVPSRAAREEAEAWVASATRVKVQEDDAVQPRPAPAPRSASPRATGVASTRPRSRRAAG